MLKQKILFLSIFSLIVSCRNNDTDTKNTVSTTNNTKSVLNQNENISVYKDSLAVYKSKINELEAESKSIIKAKNKLLDDNRELIRKTDSLTTIIGTTSTTSNKQNINPYKASISTQEEKIHKLIYSFLDSWDNLPKTKDAKTVTKFFSKKYRCNRISIDHDNTAQISWHTEKDFDEYIMSITSKKNVSFKTTNIQFLDTEIKDGLYFNSTFKYSLDTYEKDNLIDKSNFIVTITGKKINNKYKIVNYSWVRFSFM